MIYTKKKFGEELGVKISQNKSSDEISKWAFEIYRHYGLELEEGLDFFVLKLVAMEEGPEFLLSKKVLSEIATSLTTDGTVLH